MTDNHDGVTTPMTFSGENVDGDGNLTWQLSNNGGVTAEVNGEEKGMLTWLWDGEGEATAEETGSMLTCQFKSYGEVATDEMRRSMLTWQTNEEANELSKILEAAAWSEMVTCQKPKVKIIDDYPYWLPLKFQTSSAYVTINGNEELCGSSFSDSDTSYMAGIRGACCEDEMLAAFLGD